MSKIKMAASILTQKAMFWVNIRRLEVKESIHVGLKFIRIM